jgi:polyferredoxin
MSSKKIFLTFLFLLIPVILFAQEGEQFRKGISFWNVLFSVKYISVFLISAIGILLLLYDKLNSRIRVLQMLAVFLVFGVISYFIRGLFFNPSPVCASTKPFIFGIKAPYIASLSVILILTLAATKGFCSMACPVGALQELLYKIPVLKKLKKIRVHFRYSNSVRIGIAILFFIGLFTSGTSVYYYISLFDLIHWEFDLPAVELTVFILFTLTALSASIFIFRPFCYFICPMGLLTWVAEQFSIMKIRLDKTKCNNCTRCEILSPCPAIKDIMNEKKIKADCHLCGMCINECTPGALKLDIKR